MEKNNFLLTAIVLFTIVSPLSVSAYIDPGTAGMIAGGLGGTLWALILTAFAATTGILVKYFWEPIKTKISIMRTKKKEKES